MVTAHAYPRALARSDWLPQRAAAVGTGLRREPAARGSLQGADYELMRAPLGAAAAPPLVNIALRCGSRCLPTKDSSMTTLDHTVLNRWRLTPIASSSKCCAILRLLSRSCLLRCRAPLSRTRFQARCRWPAALSRADLLVPEESREDNVRRHLHAGDASAVRWFLSRGDMLRE